MVWGAFGGMLAIHPFGGYGLLEAFPKWKGLWLVLLTIIEVLYSPMVLERIGFGSTSTPDG